MFYSPDIDSELKFDDDRSSHQPFRIRNALIVDNQVVAAANVIDDVSSYAHSVRVGQQVIGPEFGVNGGKKAKAYSRSITERLHHEHEYCPCKTLTPDEIKALYDTD